MSVNFEISLMKEVQPALKESYSIFENCIDNMMKIENLQKEICDGKLSFGQKILVGFGLLFYFIPGIIYYFYAKKKNDNNDNVIVKKIKILEEEQEKLLHDFNLKRFEILTKGITSIIPENYLFPPSDAFDCILSYFENNRADSSKEAINLYEEEKHRQRVENIQKQQTYEYLLQTRGRYYADIAKKMM